VSLGEVGARTAGGLSDGSGWEVVEAENVFATVRGLFALGSGTSFAGRVNVCNGCGPKSVRVLPTRAVRYEVTVRVPSVFPTRAEKDSTAFVGNRFFPRRGGGGRRSRIRKIP